MGFTALDYQARCKAYGIDPGPVDGIWGPRTREAVQRLQEKEGASRPETLFHPSGLHRIIMHWTAGAYGDIALERQSYHLLIDQHGRGIPGVYAPEANANTSDGRYAPHTRALNTGSIGVALDAMAGARESPFDPGPAPITDDQERGLIHEVADLCRTYDIPVSRWTVLTHAEVQPTLGVWQRNKWDIRWLPGYPGVKDAIEIGDVLRAKIKAQLS